MKKIKCASCKKNIVEVKDNYEPEYCCSGIDCECMGFPTNPVFCENCAKKAFKN